MGFSILNPPFWGTDAGAAFDLWRLSAAPPKSGGLSAAPTGLVSLEALEAVQREADFAQRAGADD